MPKFTALAAVAATLMAGGIAAAKEKKADSPGAVKEKKICKSEPNPIGRIPKRTCRTQAEWDQMSGRGGLDDAASTLRGISRAN